MTEDVKLISVHDVVKEFNEAFGTVDSVDLRLSLVEEELAELAEAMAVDVTSDDDSEAMAEVLKEGVDLAYVVAGLDLALATKGLMMDMAYMQRVTGMVGAVIQIVGIPTFNEAVRRVHASNMSKLADDGKPIYREDGKVLKGPNYKKPFLLDLVSESIITP